jgi:hypothetical protein
MTDIERLAEQHIREYEARLDRIDELAARAREAAADHPEHVRVHTELDDLVSQRNQLAVQLGDIRAKAAGEWEHEELVRSGPMAIWDALAQQLEQLIERIEMKG